MIVNGVDVGVFQDQVGGALLREGWNKNEKEQGGKCDSHRLLTDRNNTPR